MLVLGLALVALCACQSTTPTQIVVSVATDISIPVPLDELRLQVHHGEKLVEDRRHWLDPATPYHLELPATLAISPAADLNVPVTVTVTGLSGSALLVSRRARLPFAANRIVLLSINLLVRCLGDPSCNLPDRSCAENGCQMIDIDPATLPDYSEALAFAGLDAGAHKDAAAAADLGLADATPADAAGSCGDEQKNGTDECEGSDFGETTCKTLGFAGGPLACTPRCKLDLEGCETEGYAYVSAGTFNAGSPPSEHCRQTNETQRWVTLTRAFEISRYEVTQGEYGTLMSDNPSMFGPNGAGANCGSDCPVDTVTWHQAAAYCNALSRQRGLPSCYGCSGSGADTSCATATAYADQAIYDCPGYRLPTEAEWEFAYRAGSNTALHPSASGDGTIDGACSTPSPLPTWDAIGWCSQNSHGTTHPVGTKQPNRWGIHDMAGNVWEWCHDWYQETLGSDAATDPWGACLYSCVLKTIRGGCWSYGWSAMRAAVRGWMSHQRTDSTIGFRCVRTRL